MKLTKKNKLQMVQYAEIRLYWTAMDIIDALKKASVHSVSNESSIAIRLEYHREQLIKAIKLLAK